MNDKKGVKIWYKNGKWFAQNKLGTKKRIYNNVLDLISCEKIIMFEGEQGAWDVMKYLGDARHNGTIIICESNPLEEQGYVYSLSDVIMLLSNLDKKDTDRLGGLHPDWAYFDEGSS